MMNASLVPALLLAATMGWSLPLDGPWKFHTGDNARWAAASFDDRSWVTQSVAAPASANDGDQGITHFAPGWAAQGFSSYTGFAWYRLRVAETSHNGDDLAILGPAMADSAYQIFVDGQLVGGSGDFSGTTPIAYGIHPAMYTLPPMRGPALVAVRVWMAPWAAGSKSGGMHVAPIIGNVSGVSAAYTVQWFEKIRAFALEIAQTCLFGALAIGALLLLPLQDDKRGPVALAIALILTGATRANLAIIWCLNVESIPAFVVVSGVILVPVTLGAWMLAWTFWLELRQPRIVYATVAMTVVYSIAEVLGWLAFNGTIPPALASISAIASKWDRYLFIALLAFIAYRGIRERRTETLTALPAIILIAAGQFSSEIGRLGIPSIWFPFGMGVSLANYAYLFSNLAIFGLLARRTNALVARQPLTPALSLG
jgi:hypothetical protein